MFALTNIFPHAAKGFKMTLANGYTVSVQWGAGNYCENHMDMVNFRNRAADSATAETAIIAPDGSFHKYMGDQVQGYQTPEDVIATFTYAASLL